MVAILEEPAPAFASKAQVLLAKTAGKMRETTTAIEVPEENRDAGDRGTATHRRPVQVWAWKPTAYGYRPRQIMSTNLANALADGWLPYCGDCGQETCGVTTDGNACTGREPLAFRRCPECHKKVFDAPNPTPLPTREGEEADPNEITDDQFNEVTPERRTRTRLETHMATYHPSAGLNYNIGIRLDLDSGTFIPVHPEGAAARRPPLRQKAE